MRDLPFDCPSSCSLLFYYFYFESRYFALKYHDRKEIKNKITKELFLTYNLVVSVPDHFLSLYLSVTPVITLR